ncbi:MAG: type VI secretion system baseplate subunit TssE [Gammaproteobacteria bacterium]|nr:type VI secretion system baseplate subunit TssE [Gammaproteobacteria bacterium]
MARELLPCLFDRLEDDSLPLERARERLRTLERERDSTEQPPTERRRLELEERIAAERAIVRDLGERVGAATMSDSLFRAAVLRDLGWLMGTASLGCTFDLEPYPQAQSAVVNFGLPGLTGWHSSALSPEGVQSAVREAIQRFEPRVLASALEVDVEMSADESDPNVLSIEIKGLMWAQPVPRRLHLMSQIDLETGAIRIEDRPA